MITVEYTGAYLDYSGYGEAVRHDIAALHAAGVPISTTLLRFTRDIADYGNLTNIAERYQGVYKKTDVQIIHTTPNLFVKYAKKETHNIGRVFWETDQLPPDFVLGCQAVQEIWTGSETNKQAILNSGIDVPVKIIPQAIDTTIRTTTPFTTDIDKNAYIFYSIFEWSTRKNPEALLQAYYKAFTKDDNVALLLKTYDTNFSQERKQAIQNEVMRIAREYRNRPPVYLYLDILDRADIYQLHASGDCYVTASRGEGWNLPLVEAMLLGNPSITTNAGGFTDYIKTGANALIVDGRKRAIENPSHNTQWYRKNQNWIDVDTKKLADAMKTVYTQKALQKRLSTAAKKLVQNMCNFRAVGEIMKKELTR